MPHPHHLLHTHPHSPKNLPFNLNIPPPQVSVQFGAFNYAKRAFEARNASASPTSSPSLSYTQYYAAGAFAGLSNTLLSSPIEHIRIRLQTQPHGQGRLYTGPIDCVRKLSAHEGVLKGVYRGTAVTWLREAQAYGVWFTSFEWMMNADARRNGVERREVPTWKVAFYGGLAGEALWLSSYPFDVVKSKMQSDGFGKDQKYSGMRDCFAKVYRAEGMRGFWKGLGPTLLRAMPVSAGTFATYVCFLVLFGPGANMSLQRRVDHEIHQLSMRIVKADYQKQMVSGSAGNSFTLFMDGHDKVGGRSGHLQTLSMIQNPACPRFLDGECPFGGAYSKPCLRQHQTNSHLSHSMLRENCAPLSRMR